MSIKKILNSPDELKLVSKLVFNRFDLNKNGYIELEELNEVLIKLSNQL